MAEARPVLRAETRLALSAVFCILAACSEAQVPPDRVDTLFSGAVSDFAKGRVAESASGFDALARLDPGQEPYLWQRGIAQYYAGRYADCRAQFELHRTVNPNDVENAAWHFLCVARAESPERARMALLPVGPDPRPPMSEVYQLFQGTLTPEDVIAAAGGQTGAQFYAHLYVGLYLEAIGDTSAAREHLVQAADERFADAGGYMHMVARVHVGLLPTER